jgi:hypothetical protein
MPYRLRENAAHGGAGHHMPADLWNFPQSSRSDQDVRTSFSDGKCLIH